MKTRQFLLIFISIFLVLCGCSSKIKSPDDTTLISIQVIDRNGFAETISTSDRLIRYQNTDFCAPQPYQKVLRVFGKTPEGKTPSYITSYHSNGHVWQYLEIVDGRAHGLYREWHLNGTQKIEFHVIEGIAELSDTALGSWVFDGMNRVWEENGALIAEISYEKGMLHGDSLYYYCGGGLQKKIPYIQNEIHGNLLFYHETGSITETIPHVRGVRQGTAIAYFPDETLCYEETFEQGLLLEGRYYTKTGELMSSVSQGNGIRMEWISPLIKHSVQYQRGAPEGDVECFDEKGNLKVRYQQKNGKKHGEEWEYYALDFSNKTLQPKLLLHWQEDILQGIVKTWFPSGVQQSQKEIYQNKKNGQSLAWFSNGSLMLSEEYEKDLLVSGTYYKKGDKKPISRVHQGKGIATIYHADGYLLHKIFYEKGVPCLDDPSK
jgi:antitoxin component YwqK of YwqJK toxin-antitoxin module